ncbi:MAG TPA: tRNA (guanosine(46)-N7)-methyltransferase TrmB [Planctomycetaceae bacterium]|nr:tRNA (guanosine(46)-N7)-methyltransferase TrmB [Planctomycetaceae bacterium]
MVQPGKIEREFGVPFPGRVLAPERWTNTALKNLPQDRPLDWQAVFGRRAPVVLELGCGNGRFLIGSALQRPDYDHVGIDALPIVVRYAVKRANERGLKNVRFAVAEALQFLQRLVPPHSVREVHLYHPQPYDDPAEAHRRLVTPRFLALVHRALEPGGLFVVQTDNKEYWRYMQRVIPALFEFQEHEGAWPDAPLGRTRREIIARRRGYRIFRGTGTPRTDHSDEAIEQLLERLPAPAFRTRGKPTGRR